MATGLLEKANDAQVSLGGDATLVYEDKVVVIGNSTVDAPGEWFHRLVRDYWPSRYKHTFKYCDLVDRSDKTSGFKDLWTAYSNPNASRTVEVYNAAVGGLMWDDITASELSTWITDVNPTVVVFALGLGSGDAGLEAGLKSLADDVAALAPTADFVWVASNPVSADSGASTAKDAVFAAQQAKGGTFVNIYQAYIDYGDWETDLLSDGIHPNDAGSKLGALTADAALTSLFLPVGDDPPSSDPFDDAELELRAAGYAGSGAWQDQSGNDRDATPNGTPEFLTDRFIMDGTADYFTVPTATELDAAAEFTALVAVITDGGHDEDIALSKMLSTGEGRWRIWYASSTVNVQVADGATAASVGSTFELNRPMVIGLRRSSETLWISENGELVNSVPDTVGAVSNTRAVAVGARSNGSLLFPGEILAAAVWSRALTDAELLEASASLKATTDRDFSAASLASRWAAGKVKVG